jgi:hypothetical protein
MTIMATKTFTAGDFLKALAEGSLTEPITREGVAKPDPSDHQAVLFSEGDSCRSWLKVPTDSIKSVEVLDMRTCKEHNYPFIRLHLKEPTKDNALATLFAGLARRSSEGITLPRDTELQIPRLN